MTAASRKSSRRYSRESQQEDRSEAQIKERFAAPGLGWPCDRLGRDLGEDLHVRIYDDGQSTGLDFYVQLKSTTDAQRFRRRDSSALAYRLETKDLEHWEKQLTLVVLVVWDVAKREGWWRPVQELIEELDGAGKGWRKKKTITVTVPLANTTDASGLARLRRLIADHGVVIASHSMPNDFSLVFETTGEGLAALDAFKRAVDFDEPLLLDGLHAPRIMFPDWHRRLYGHAPLLELTSMPKGTTAPAEIDMVVRVEVESAEGHAEYTDHSGLGVALCSTI